MVNQKAKPARILEVRAMFEPCRIATREEARAYERLMPTSRRRIAETEPDKTVEPEEEIRSRQGGGQ